MDQISELCAKYHVRDLYAFGSVLDGSFNETSDIDFLVSFKAMGHDDYAECYLDLADEFENIFGRRVDLLTEKSLSNPYFKKEILNRRIRLYG
jgi:predicted nucleotidyltransferase